MSPVRRIAASPASRLRQQTRAMQDAGRDVIVLSSGDLDWPTPPHVVAAAHAAALRGETQYTNADGTPALKDAIRAKLARENSLDYRRDEVIVCNGSIQAMFSAFMATLEPGDEVIVPAPYWASYLDQVRLAGAIPVTLACAPDDGFKLRPRQLDAAITARTRWLVLNNPTNPTGALYSVSELAALAQVLLRHTQVRILADDLYEHFVYGGRTFATMAAVEPRLKQRVLTVNGVSKAYAMMGWRIGYAAGARELIEDMARIQSHTAACPSSIGQAAALAALAGPPDVVRERVALLSARRDLMVEMLDRIPGLSCAAPDGTFYVFPSCAGVIGTRTPEGAPIDSAGDFATYLLDSAGVAVLPGEDCGWSGHVRASFALAPERLREAARRLERACAALRPSGNLTPHAGASKCC